MADRDLRKEMDLETEREKEKERAGLVRKITFQELAGELAAYKPAPVRSRKKIADLDPYFTMLDNGRDFIMQKRKYKDLVDKLPGELQDIMNELEGLMKQMTLDAVEDNYDYQDRMGRYYLNMIRVNELSENLKFKLRRLSNNQKGVERYLGAIGSKQTNAFLTQVGLIATTASELSTSCNMFMDKMEKDYDILLPQYIKDRAMARDNMVLSLKLNQ